MATPTQSSLLEVSPRYEAALERAGRWLALRARTESELAQRLEEGGFERGVVTQVIARLKELDLIDDAAFARSWVEERMRKKDCGPILVAEELEAKGVDETIVLEVVGEFFPDEGAQATEAAAALVGKWAGLPLDKQAARLSGALSRKGYSPDAIDAALQAVLPPEGWD